MRAFRSTEIRGTTWGPLDSAIRWVHSSRALDSVASRLARVSAVATASPRIRDVLRGAPLGHAAHPALTDLPIGAWTSASLLDVFGGEESRRAATGLLAFGVATAVPAVATGLAEWEGTTGAARRAGALHATLNGAAFSVYLVSLIARLRGCHDVAVKLGLLGGLVAGGGGYLGGHLSVALKVGSRDRALVPK